MVRFAEIIMAYFIIGAVMWGGGAVQWGEVGLASEFISDPGGPDSSVQANEQTGTQLQQTGGPIQEAMQQVGGSGLLAVWNLVAGLIGYLFWPVGVLVATDAPPRVTVLFGGSLVVAFFGALVALYIAGD